MVHSVETKLLVYSELTQLKTTELHLGKTYFWLTLKLPTSLELLQVRLVREMSPLHSDLVSVPNDPVYPVISCFTQIFEWRTKNTLFVTIFPRGCTEFLSFPCSKKPEYSRFSRSLTTYLPVAHTTVSCNRERTGKCGTARTAEMTDDLVSSRPQSASCPADTVLLPPSMIISGGKLRPSTCNKITRHQTNDETTHNVQAAN